MAASASSLPGDGPLAAMSCCRAGSVGRLPLRGRFPSVTAIEEKIQAEQLSLKFEYILDQEKQESERKIIEAKAKAESNQILTASLSDKILKDKGIEATLKLANSPNSKIIIIGSGKDGLPLILGNQN